MSTPPQPESAPLVEGVDYYMDGPYLVFTEAAQESDKRAGESDAECGNHTNHLRSFGALTIAVQGDGFIKRNTQHGIGGFELFLVCGENVELFIGKPGTPIIFH